MILLSAIFNFKEAGILERERQTAGRWHILTWAVIGTGIFLRLFHFFHNRSLWIDESFLANSLVRLSFSELISGPLEYEQKAPIGYLVFTKLCVLLFGKTEMALRLFSLLCGIASLFLFRSVAAAFLRPAGIFVAMAILAIAPPFVYYSVEAKQYCTEMLATVVVLLLYVRCYGKTDLSSLLLWGVAGAVVIWFSYSSIFVLAGMAAAVSLHLLLRKDWKGFVRYLLPFSLWMISFGVNYLLFTRKHAGSDWLVEWFAQHKAFLALPPTSAEDLKIYIMLILDMLNFSLGLSWIDLPWTVGIPPVFSRLVLRMPVVSVVVIVVAMIWFFRQNRLFFMILLFPFLLNMLAAGLKIYPFYDRMTFYLGPLLILMAAKGCETLLIRYKAYRWKYAIVVLLLIGAVGNSVAGLVVPDHIFPINKRPAARAREAVMYVNERFRPGDVVYVYWNFEQFHRYYSEAYDLKFRAISGSDVRFASSDTLSYVRNLQPDRELMAGRKRVWFISSKIKREAMADPFGKPEWYYPHPEPGKIFYNALAATGEEKDKFESAEFLVTLFDFSGR